MGDIINVDFNGRVRASGMDINKLAASARLKSCNISAMRDDVGKREVSENHTSEPIKSLDMIDSICEWLISNGRYRDHMLFVVGINFGLRIGDLLSLRFCDIIDSDFNFRNEFVLIEQKTRNTRKKLKNRCIYINSAVVDAVLMFIENSDGVSLSDYMFMSESRGKRDTDCPITRQAVDKILKRINRELQLGIKMSSHTLRKTFAYHQMAMSNHDQRKLLLLQKMFGHSTAAQTLDYIGLTQEEIADAYCNLNLGSDAHYRTYCKLSDSPTAM